MSEVEKNELDVNEQVETSDAMETEFEKTDIPEEDIQETYDIEPEVTVTDNNGGTPGQGNKTTAIIVALSLAILVGIVVLICFAMGGKSSVNSEAGAAYDFEEAGYVTLGEYKNITVSVEVTDADVKEEKDYILDEDVYQKLDGTAKANDMVCINYKGTCDGNPIEDESAEDVEIQLGDEEIFAEFDQGIVGMNTGDTKTIDVVLPTDSGYGELEGKTAQYEVTLNYICGELVKPELNDEFVTSYTDGECTSLADFDDYLRNELYESNVSSIADDVWEQVVNNATVEKYPDDVLDKAIEETKKNYENFSEMSGYESTSDFLDEFGMTEDDIEDVAKDTAAEKMIAKTIAAKDGLTMNDDVYRNLLVDYMEYENGQADNMSLEDIETEYRESYGEEPRDGMLLEYIKTYVADNAKVEGLK